MPDHLTIATLGLRDDLVARLAAAGHATTSTPARTADASLVLSAFPDDQALVSATASGSDMVGSLRAGAIHATTGLHGRATIERVAEEHERQGCSFVAAPLLLAPGPDHGPAAALGGSADAVARVQPVFEAIGVTVVATCERAADGALLAIAHSAMVGCAMEAIAEAFTLVQKFGVEASLLRDVMADALFADTVYGPLANAMLANADADLPSASRGVQILDLALHSAGSARVPLASVDACRDRLLSAIARGSGDRAWTVVAREQARASGLE